MGLEKTTACGGVIITNIHPSGTTPVEGCLEVRGRGSPSYSHKNICWII